MKRSVENTKQPIDLVWQLSQPSQIAFNLFQNLVRTKQLVDSIKQQVVFHLVKKHSILKRFSNQISSGFKQGVDYTLIHLDPTPYTAATSVFHRTPWIWILQSSWSLLINTKDLEAHLTTFKAQMMISGGTNVVHCKIHTRYPALIPWWTTLRVTDFWAF